MGKRFIILTSLLGVSISVFFESSLNNQVNKVVEKCNTRKEEISVKKKEKIVFEGFDNVVPNGEKTEIKKYVKNNYSDNVDITIKFDDDYKENVERPPLDASNEEVNLAIRRKRDEVKRYFSRENKKKLNRLKVNKVKNAFISKYSPYVDISISKNDFVKNDFCLLDEFENNSDIDTVYVKERASIKYEENLDSSLPTVGLKTIADIPTLPYSGSGVNVGILEAGGVFDKNNPNFVGTTAVARDVWYFSETVSDHATRVASIVGGKYGIARGCQIYCDELSGNPKNEVEWMLDNNANIITNSWGEVDDSKTGEYNSNSAYFDYICRMNWCTICAAAGNAGTKTGFVGNPGLGFNVITVGNCYDNDTLRSTSSYIEGDFGVSKPTLVAPGYEISVPNMPDEHHTGTSFSTPIVAGTVALLMEEYPSLKTYPEIIISLLTATATKMSSAYSNIENCGLEDKVGAGKLCYTNATAAKYQHFNFNNESNETKRYIASKEVYFRKNDTMRVSLAWIVDSNDKTNIDFVTDYDLYIFNSKGERVAVSQSSGNNIELIEKTVPEDDFYTIKVFQWSSKKGKHKDYGSVTYYSY